LTGFQGWRSAQVNLTFKTEAELDFLELRNHAGVRARFHPHGGLYALECGEILINQALSSPLDRSLSSLRLRRASGSGFRSVCLTGPLSPAYPKVLENALVWRGRWGRLTYRVHFRLHAEEPTWIWRVVVSNRGRSSERLDFFYSQDLGLGARGYVRGNEAYVSQYLDHTVLRNSLLGFAAFTRQNAEQTGGTFPWLVQGLLPASSAYATDGFDYFGLDVKAAGKISALSRASLPSCRKQGEFALITLQSAPRALGPGESAEWVAFAHFVPDHPEASGEKDLERLPELVRTGLELANQVPSGRSLRGGGTAARSVFHLSEPLSTTALSRRELREYFPGPWRHEERVAGKLGSFFHSGHSHVVLPAKESAVPRPHGHILRSGSERFPDERTLCSTCYMFGVFNSHVTLGNTNLNKLLSVNRNPLNLLRVAGQRICVRQDGRWRPLGVPSAFDLSPSFCRWIYRTRRRTIEVRSWVSANAPVVCLCVDIQGEPAELLITHDVVLGDAELEGAGEVEIDSSAGRAWLTPGRATWLARRYPDAVFGITAYPATGIRTVGTDDLLWEDRQGRGLPQVVYQTEPVRNLTLALCGDLYDGRHGIEKHLEALSPRPSFAAMTRASASFWNDLLQGARLHARRAKPVARLDDILPWFTHNAMIHYTSPHGLEQYGGAAWGVRDVCQGPVELLLALEQPGKVAEILRMVFRHQYADDGSWPQWFMFAPYAEIQHAHSHGDIIIWPLKALCDYLEDGGDPALLQEQLPYTRKSDFAETSETAPLAAHARKLIDRIKQEFIPGTSLIRYGDGDWDDTLQPADQSMRTHMVSGWTVELVFQTFQRYARCCRRFGDEPLARELAMLAQAMQQDFRRWILRDGVVAGFVHFSEDGRSARAMLHPEDKTTGIRYRLLPMTRGIISGIFTPEEAARHLALIRGPLSFPDGVRLMDRPAEYRGGLQRHFRRAETASNFGREIGLQYVHAHLRYLEALSALGKGRDLLEAMLQVNPIDLASSVPNAAPRQANAYFSSSDGDFPDRYEAMRRFDELRTGKVAAKGGWRIYSSGPGIYVSLLIRFLLGLRRHFDDLFIDPVLPKPLDGLRFEFALEGRPVEICYHVKDEECSPKRVSINGSSIEPLRHAEHPYRKGGALIPRAEVRRLLKETGNRLEVYL